MGDTEDRRVLLARFINALREEIGFNFNINKFESRLKLQKLVFLARRFGLPLNYEFNYYIRGPYSRILAEDYYNLPSIDDSLILPNNFIELVKKKNARWLELASSLVMIFEKYGDMDTAIYIVAKNKMVSEKKLRDIAETLSRWGAVNL